MIVIVMGVSGSGKSTVGKMLATALNWEFSDADSFHSPANVEKMREGISLTDADRLPWLIAIREAIAQWLQDDRHTVLACSALKSTYRQMLYLESDRMRLIYLKVSFESIRKRLEVRQNHFMSKDLLQSQFDTLEEPESSIHVDADRPPEAIVREIIANLGILN